MHNTYSYGTIKNIFSAHLWALQMPKFELNCIWKCRTFALVLCPSSFQQCKIFIRVSSFFFNTCSGAMNARFDIPLCALQIVFIAVAIFYTYRYTNTYTLVEHITLLKLMLTSFQCSSVLLPSWAPGETCHAYATLHTNEAKAQHSWTDGSKEFREVKKEKKQLQKLICLRTCTYVHLLGLLSRQLI